jgi:hypothetical protein
MTRFNQIEWINRNNLADVQKFTAEKQMEDISTFITMC